MNHADLVRRAERWLRTTKRLRIVLSDVRMTSLYEQPDAIGFTLSGYSLLIECKASRADFRRDETKQFRRCPELGMGRMRYYMAPAGLLAKATIPSGWGLLEADESGRIAIVKRPTPFADWNWRSEQTLIVGALARATESWGRGMFGEIAPLAENGDPHPKAARVIREQQTEIRRLKALLAKAPAGLRAEESTA